MRILIVHNLYRQRGGEDAVVEAEAALLRRHGHDVETWFVHNDRLDPTRPLMTALDAMWSIDAYGQAALMVDACRPDVVHVHNTFALLSPSVLWAAARSGAAVVQTLHNYRIACAQAMLLREGRSCSECLGRWPLPALRHGCYRGSRSQTAVVAGTIALHRTLGTWRHAVHRYVALSRFSADRFAEAGIPAGRIRVKPNFVEAPPLGADGGGRDGLLFVGRLAEEKGIAVLAEALRRVPGVTLRVAGDGPLAPLLQGLPNVQRLGHLAPDEVLAQMRRARALVMPSIVHEHFPRVLAEAYASGLPVITHRLGALAELVDDGVTGRLCEPGDIAGLAALMREAADDAGALAAMGHAARERYERLYAPERNHDELVSIYREAVDTAAGAAPRPRWRRREAT